MELHPWQPLKVHQRPPRAARRSAAAAATVCHKPEWLADGWSCKACGARFRDAATAAAATTQACRAAFGGSFHASHAITTGVARGGAWQDGKPLAICRSCACYSAHQAVGLTKPCRHSTAGRKARLTRFLAGRHPEPGLAHVHVDGVVHYPRGRCGGNFAHAGRRKAPDAAGTKRAAAAAEGAQRSRRRGNDAGAVELAAVAVVTLHEAAHFGLVNSASEGEAGGQEGQHPMSDAELAIDLAVSVFAVAVDVAGASSEEEFGLDVEVSLD